QHAALHPPTSTAHLQPHLHPPSPLFPYTTLFRSPTVRIASGGADLILGCDIVVSASATALSRVERGVTQAIVNADLQPTANKIGDRKSTRLNSVTFRSRMPSSACKKNYSARQL